MKYEVVVDAERRTMERYRVTLEADSEEEAMDVAWEVVSDPKTDLKVNRCLRERQETLGVDVIGADVIEEGYEADGVFNDQE